MSRVPLSDYLLQPGDVIEGCERFVNGVRYPVSDDPERKGPIWVGCIINLKEPEAFNSKDKTRKDARYVVERSGEQEQVVKFPVKSKGWHVEARRLNPDGTYNRQGEVVQFFQSGDFAFIILPELKKPVSKYGRNVVLGTRYDPDFSSAYTPWASIISDNPFRKMIVDRAHEIKATFGSDHFGATGQKGRWSPDFDFSKLSDFELAWQFEKLVAASYKMR